MNAHKWPLTRETLVHRLRAEASGAHWEHFAEVYGPLVHHYCRCKGLQDADASDVTQNVFLAVRRGITSFDYDPKIGKFRNWLRKIAVREIQRNRSRMIRGGQPEEFVDLTVAESDPVWDELLIGGIQQAALQRIRPDFEDLTWRAFELWWLEKKTPAEVANQMGQKPDWVYQAKYRVVKRFEDEVRWLASDLPGFA